MQTVLVRHKSIYDRKGNARITTAKNIVQGIKLRYFDGRVQTTGGDVWNVEPCPSNKADFQTITAVEA